MRIEINWYKLCRLYLEEVAISAFLIPISDFKQKTRNLHINAPLIWFANRHFNNRRSLLLKKKQKKKKQAVSRKSYAEKCTSRKSVTSHELESDLEAWTTNVFFGGQPSRKSHSAQNFFWIGKQHTATWRSSAKIEHIVWPANRPANTLG